tara:strand:+ start:66 stop:716 length:651 start_codon:yes stop_codon:yes gene_type:complete
MINTIGILGGAGSLGTGICFRLAKCGYNIIIGSRNPQESKILELPFDVENLKGIIKIDTNYNAAKFSDLVILTVPFRSHKEIVQEISDAVNNKILIDTTVPLVPPKVARVQLPEFDSVAKWSQDFLGNDVDVVSAFQNVAASHLLDDDILKNEILVCGNSKNARKVVIDLIDEMGMKGWHAGSINNSVVSESLTSVLIFINKFYKIKGSGISIIDT